MSDTLYAYKNVVDGNTYVFAAERPDLEARPNFEKVDTGDVPQSTIDAALREKAQADSIAAAGKTRESAQAVNGQDATEPSYSASVLGAQDPLTGVFQTATSGAKPVGGVLSRGVVQAPLTRDELVTKAQADAEALVLHGVLSDQLDGSQARTGLPTNAVADVVNAMPVGDVKSTTRGRKAGTKGAAPKVPTTVTEPTTPAPKPATSSTSTTSTPGA